MQRGLVNDYARGADAIAEAVAGVPASLRTAAPGPDAWSINEILVHLSDAEIILSERLRRALADEEAELRAFDEEAWGDRLHYAERDPDAALDLLRTLRRANADLLRRLSDDEWERTGTHTERGPMTVRDIVKAYIDHVAYHLRQIEAIKDENSVR